MLAGVMGICSLSLSLTFDNDSDPERTQVEVFVLAPPAIQGLGQSSGFSMYLEDTAANGRNALAAASNLLADTAGKTSDITDVRGYTRTLESQLKLSIDREQAGALGIDLSGINVILIFEFAKDLQATG